MNTNEILEGNKLIAEFMGLEKNDLSCKYSECIGYKLNKESIFMLPNHLNYHSSWDLLMPVIKKCLIGECENKFDYSYLYESLCNIDLKETFIEVVEFIKWYNLNNK